MLAPAVVTIVVNGLLVPSSAPPRIDAGHVFVPLAPVVTGLATRATIHPDDGTVVIERADRRITVPVVFVEGAVPYLRFATLVQALGGTVHFDAATKTLEVVLHETTSLATPLPFDPRAPQVAPTTIFTPEPPKPTPRVIFTGPPVPRRTPIPARPSWPVIPP